MAWSVLQSAGATNNGATSTVAATFATANLTAGTKVIAYVGASVGAAFSISSVQDGAGNSWALVAGPVANGFDAGSIYILDTPAGDVGTKPTITVTASHSGGYSLVLQEVSGLAAGSTSAVLDGTPATLTGTGGGSTGSPSYSTAAASEFLVCLYADDGANNTVAQAAGWTLDPASQNTKNTANCCVQYKNSTGGAETNGWTGAAAAAWELAEVAFKLPGAAPVSSGLLMTFP